MTFFDKMKKRIPGGSVSVAKTMLKAFRQYKRLNPDCSREDAFRYTVESRYKILKSVNKERIEWILERTECLETMVCLAYLEENNLTKYIDMEDGSAPPMIEQISDDIAEFFNEEVPEEAVYTFRNYL